MRKNSRKGLTLIELLIVLALIIIVSPLIFSNLIYGIDTYNTMTKYMGQQDRITEVIQYIRKDVEESSACITHVGPDTNEIELSFSDGRPTKYWRFKDNSLEVQIGSTVSKMVDGLKATSVGSALPIAGASPSRFAFYSNQKRLIVIIQPEKTNNGWHDNRNINKPITAEFSVKYKKVS